MGKVRGLTIKDVAKRANVSTATVSYVLNDNNTSQVGAETRARVLEVVSELRYQRNTIAQSLRTSKSSTVGVIVEDMMVFNSPQLIDGINEFMDSKGYHIVLSNLRLNARFGHRFANVTAHVDEIRESVEVLLSRQIDGMIYIGEHPRDVTGLIETGETPVVYTYCYTTGPNDLSVNYDDTQGGYIATRHLIELGHRRIGVVSGLEDSRATQSRVTGCANALSESGLTLSSSHVVPGEWEYRQSYEASHALLSQEPRPTAVFAMNDLMAMGVLDAAKELGLSVPGELSVIGFDNREFTAFCTPKLSTVALPLREMGARAGEILEALVDRKPVKGRSARLPCTVIKRETTGPAPVDAG